MDILKLNTGEVINIGNPEHFKDLIRERLGNDCAKYLENLLDISNDKKILLYQLEQPIKLLNDAVILLNDIVDDD